MGWVIGKVKKVKKLSLGTTKEDVIATLSGQEIRSGHELQEK